MGKAQKKKMAKLKSKSKARVIRDGTVVYNGEILTLFRYKREEPSL